MGFDARQRRALRAKLRLANVRTRVQNGRLLRYIEGWQAIAEANRIFGHDNWDRETRAPACIWSDRQRGAVSCLYSSQVRITVRAGSTTVMRDGVGVGFARDAGAEVAHDMAIKAAETDATKRALATFGNPFGLALYDKTLANVTAPTADSRATPTSADRGARTLAIGPDRQLREFATTRELVDAVTVAVAQLSSVETVFAFWEANVAHFAALQKQDPLEGPGAVDAITAQFKTRLQGLGGASAGAAGSQSAPELVRAKDRRVRDAEHLAFVARHPCVVCGRRPSHAHHLRFAQPRALSLKVSYEYTVPLCAGHHDSLHRTGNESAWWAGQKIDPLPIARQLWAAPDKRSEIALEPSGTGNGAAGLHTDLRQP